MTDQACHDVDCAAWGKANDDAHRTRRISLRRRDKRCERQRGGARGAEALAALDLGEYVPTELYRAVAAALLWAYRLGRPSGAGVS